MDAGVARSGGWTGDQVTWMSMRTTPLRGLFLAAVMLLAPLAGLAPAAATHTTEHMEAQGDWPPHETGNLTFMALNETPLDTDGKGTGSIPRVHGPGAVVMLNVTDKDLVEDFIRVRVTSTSDDIGEEILLHRMEGKRYPVYHGFLGFETSPVADNGEVYVQDGDTVSAIYIDDEDLTDQVAVSQDFVQWFVAAPGSVTLDNTQYRGAAAEAEVTVQDADIPVTAGTFDVLVTSDSDPDGIILSIPQLSQGQYRGRFGFGAETDVGVVPPRIAVQDGDKVRVEYAEPGFNTRGHEEEPSDEAVWVQSFTGILQFTTEDYNTLLAGPGACPPGGPCLAPEAFGQSTGTSASDANAWLRLEDKDLAGRKNLTINLRSTHPTRPAEVDPTGIAVTLTETGPATGEFLGFLGFISASPSTGNRLRVVEGAEVEARYTDADDALGEQATQSAALTWHASFDAALTFTTSATTTTRTASYNGTTNVTLCGGPCAKGFLYFRDEDRKDDSVPGDMESIQVTSSRDQLGVTVTVIESGDTGVFRGEFHFNGTNSLSEGDGPGGLAAIWAPHGTNLNAFAYEERGADGDRRKVVEGQVGGTTGTAVQVVVHAPDRVSLPAVVSETLILSKTPGGSAASSFAPGETAHVVLVDPHLSASTATVHIGRPGAWPDWTGAGDALTGGAVSPVTVTRTTIGSTVQYRGEFLVPGGLQEGDNLCAFFLHHNATGVRTNVLTPPVCPAWTPLATSSAVVDASITFRTAAHLGADMGIGVTGQETYYGLRSVHVFVRDEDRFADTTKNTDQIEVRIVSEADPTGIRIKLRERYGDSGITSDGVRFPSDIGFIGSFDFTTGSSVPGKSLKVSDGDTVSVFYDDPRNDTGKEETFVAFVRWEQTTSGSMSIDRSLYRYELSPSAPGNFVEVTITDKDQDRTSVQDTIASSGLRLEAFNPRNGDFLFFSATETTGGSGLFRGKFTFEREDNLAGAPAADRLLVRDGDEFEVYYHETNDTAGKAVEHRRTATWLDATATHLSLDKKTYTTFDAVATITLVDKDKDVTALKDEFYVFVTSDRDGGGERILVRETSGRSGEFVGSFGFEGARVLGNGRLAVQDGDRISVHFIDKEQDGDGLLDEKAPKRADAVWEANVNSPPDVAVTTTPALDGTTVRIDPGDSVSFMFEATDKDGTVVSWGLDFGDGTTPINATGTPPATIAHSFNQSGTYIVNFTATDDDGAQTLLSITVLVKTKDTDPPGAVTGLRVVEANIGRVVLAWSAPKNNETGTGTAGPDGYEIRRSAAAIADEAAFDAATPVPLGSLSFSPAVRTQTAGKEQQVTVSGLERSTTYFFAVRATDLGGNKGPFATVPATTLAADNTAPRGVPVLTSSHPAGEPTDDRDITILWTTVEEPDTPASLRYYVILNEQDAYTVNCISEEATTGTSWSRYGTDDGTYYFHLAAGSDGGCGPTVTYGPIVVAVDDGPVDEGPTDLEIRNANTALLLQVSAVRQDGGNLVTWSLPQGQPAVVAGVQIWRSESPYALAADLDADSEEFQKGEYFDEGASADALYLVTLYYVGGFGKASDSAGAGIPGFSEMEGRAVQTADAAEKGFFQKLIDDYWLWLLIGLGALVLILVTVLAVLMRPRSKAKEDEAWDEAAEEGMAWPEAEPGHEAGADDGWPALDEEEYAADEDDVPNVLESESPFGGPEEEYYDPGEGASVPGAEYEEVAEEEADPNAHHLSCPACGAGFTAHGPRPLVTECPSCGVRGVLR